MVDVDVADKTDVEVEVLIKVASKVNRVSDVVDDTEVVVDVAIEVTSTYNVETEDMAVELHAADR